MEYVDCLKAGVMISFLLDIIHA